MSENLQLENVTKASFSSGHALVIAIAAYAEVNPLPTVVINDAREISGILTSSNYCGYKPKNVVSLLDGEATIEAIRSELEALAVRAKPDDTVVIFFSGHGANLGTPLAPRSALVPVDCELSDVSNTVLLEDEFSSALSCIKAQRLVVFIDACHSGGAGTLKGLEGNLVPNLGFSEKSLGRLAQGVGRVIIASSRASETSLIISGASNSLFTEHLVNALKGAGHTQKDGFIRVFDIFNHVSEKVKAAVPGRQHPIFKASDLEDNFPVSLDCGGVKALTNNESEQALWRKLEDIFADLYPLGPQDQDIWLRASGDISRLNLNGNGRVQWFSALKTMRQGGGGKDINQQALLDAALEDFPHHPELQHLSAR